MENVYVVLPGPAKLHSLNSQALNLRSLNSPQMSQFDCRAPAESRAGLALHPDGRVDPGPPSLRGLRGHPDVRPLEDQVLPDQELRRRKVTRRSG